MQMHSSHSKCHEQWQQRRCTLLVREEGLGGKGKRPCLGRSPAGGTSQGGHLSALKS